MNSMYIRPWVKKIKVVVFNVSMLFVRFKSA